MQFFEKANPESLKSEKIDFLKKSEKPCFQKHENHQKTVFFDQKTVFFDPKKGSKNTFFSTFLDFFKLYGVF